MTHEDRIAHLERRVAELEAIVGVPAHSSGVHGSPDYGGGHHISGVPYSVAIGSHAHAFILPDGTIASGGLTLIPVTTPETFRTSAQSAG